ncbi:MAG: phosphoenolpyruvate synthase PpsA [Desulfobacterales bacterium]|nr:phosphoenolpyruvate synthase PpsA [Desulfobacterales bacterium]
MKKTENISKDNYDPFFKIYHELMKEKVEDILLVSCPYDAFIMEEEGKLATRIINEYRGLNLSRPPKLSWVSSAEKAFEKLSVKNFDLVIAMPSLDDVNVHEFAGQVKETYPDLSFYLLVHNTSNIHNYINGKNDGVIDRIYVWGGNADLLLAIIKNREDQMNVEFDTKNANVRVIILVEDSPYHFSAFLPVLYKQIVEQTQAVIDESLNEDHRLLQMRGRPKVLVAQNYEEAWSLYKKYKPYLLSIFSDMRFPKKGITDVKAGYDLLKKIKQENPNLPLLALSTEEQLKEKITKIPAVFINKNSLNLNDKIHKFFIKSLGFGDFIFTMPDGKEIASASDLRSIEKLLPDIPDESILYHAQNNDFSRWLMARSEIDLAIKLRPYKIKDFPLVQDMRKFLIATINERRKGSRQGVVIDFNSDQFDSDTTFIKIGKGSLGGKARGLAFMASQLKKSSSLNEKFPQVDFTIPKTLVITTEGFKSFIENNNLALLLEESTQYEDKTIIKLFLEAELPEWLEANLRTYLEYAKFPIAVRSSSLFEDAHYQPFAGLYRTYMLPNSDPDFEARLKRLIKAIKLVYASTYLKAPKAYAKSTMHRIEDEEMGVVLQQLIGTRHENYFYPAISGVAQSYNFYPIASLKAEDGISYIALGLGKIVMEGGKTLRFCPKQPQLLPQFSAVDDILKNAQNFFYVLKTDKPQEELIFSDDFNDDPFVAKIDISDAGDHPIVQALSSTYYPGDNKIRDSFSKTGYPVLTFASVLKYDLFPLAKILEEVTQIGSKWMGTSIEIEFAVNIGSDGKKAEFSLLQIRPMGRYRQNMDIKIKEEDIKEAFCFSTMSLGNGEYEDIFDIIYVDPEKFDSAKTIDVAAQINKLNAKFNNKEKKYVLIGPGRWGTSDRWLGIPVSWNDISNVGVMVETTIESIKADPSQGSHFFQNITSLGISYITVLDKGEDFIDYEWLKKQPSKNETQFLRHISFKKPIKILVNGKTSQAVIKKVG